MTAASIGSLSAVDVMRQQARIAHAVVRMNTDGLSHAESLIQPQPGGNCLNWVVGHLIAIYHHTFPLLGQEPVLPEPVRARYDRGSAPMRDAAEASDFSELLNAWDETSRRFDTGLATLSPDALTNPAPRSPSNDPNETIGSLLSTISWHQAYHVGQTGLLRRVAGKRGAIP
jgi:uncharacterized damage-inducible protein DinB